MQKFPLRNRCKPNNNKAFGSSSDTHIRMRRDCCNPHDKMPPSSDDVPQRLQRISQPIPSASATTSLEKCQLTMEKPMNVCNRVFTKETENVATWNDVLSGGRRRGCKQSKSLPLPPPPPPPLSAVSSALEVMVVESDIAPAERQEPVQRITSAEGKLEVLCNVTASSSNTSSNNKNNNSDANGNRNKDDDDGDDDNNRRSRLELEQQNHQSKTQAKAAVMSAAASAREFITFERLRLGDQINFLLFDPYRTLKFLITELKSRLKTAVPDDINVQKILVEIQQTIKRIRIPNNASEPVLQPAPTRMMAVINTKTTTATTSTEEPPMATSAKSESTAEAAAVKYILPKERCHVIKNDPLRNHARKVNSSCQTIAAQLENVNACQLCEHYQVKHHQGTVGCNQNRINEKNTNADDVNGMEDMYSTGAYQERSKDHRKDMELRESCSCKSQQDTVEILKIKNDPFSRDTQRIIAQLEIELLNFQRELQRTSSSILSEPHGEPLGGSSQENSKVQSKRSPWLDKKQENPEQGVENINEEEQTFHNDKLQLKFWKHCNRLNSSSTQTAATGVLSISKESQTNLKNPTQMFCHLEKEKLLLMQKFQTSEMQTIEGDLNELHVFIKDQLNGIYQSITRENQNSKYFSNDNQSRRRGGSAYKNKQKSRQKNFSTLQQPEKIQAKGLPPPPPPPLSSSPSLTAPTSSSVLSSSQRIHEGVIPLPTELRSTLPRHYKKSSSPNNGNANNTKSMMKHKSSSSSPSTADAKERHNISDVDKADRAVDGKKSKNSHQQLYGHQEHLFANCRADCGFTDTPFCSGGKRNHFSNVDCRCRRRSSQLGTGTQINGNAKRMMGARATRTSTTKSDINSTKTGRPDPAVMPHYQRHQRSTTTAGIAQDRIELIFSSLPGPAAVMTTAPSYISTRTTDETSRNPDTVMNAAVKTIIKDAYATTVTAATAVAAATPPVPEVAGHSNGIREPSHQSRNSWQRDNLKNPTGCQMKKQICGADGYECTIHNNNNNNGNRSNYPQIHDCQKYRANSINPFCGLCSAKMHEVGADNGATAFAAATTSDDSDYDDDDNDDNRGYGDDIGAGGDGPINWKEENKSLVVEGKFICHPKKRQQQRPRRWREQTPGLLHCCVAQSAFQTDLNEFKEFLDDVFLSTPRTE